MVEFIHEFLFLVGDFVYGQLNLTYDLIFKKCIDKNIPGGLMKTILNSDDLEYIKVVHLAHGDQEVEDSDHFVLL